MWNMWNIKQSKFQNVYFVFYTFNSEGPMLLNQKKCILNINFITFWILYQCRQCYAWRIEIIQTCINIFRFF